MPDTGWWNDGRQTASTEIYDGNEYFVSDEGNIAAALPGENWDVHNALIEHLVETFGTNYIAELCGLERRVCKI